MKSFVFIFLLSLLSGNLFAVNGELSYSESWDFVYYSYGLASQILNINVTLSTENPAAASLLKTFDGNVCAGCVELNETMVVYSKLEHSYISFALKYDRTYLSSYEVFEYDESAPISYNIGPCFDDEDKPEENAGYDDYVMCCLESTRGFGSHCLRHNRSIQYDTYKLDTAGNSTMWLSTDSNLTVSDANTGGLYSLSVNSAGDYAMAYSNNSFKVELRNIDDDYYNSSQLNSTIFHPYRLFVPTNFTGEILDDTDVFFMKNEDIPKQLSMPPSKWAKEADCTQPLHSNTAVNFDSDHVNDQFYTLKNVTLTDMFTALGEMPSRVLFNDASSILFVFDRPLVTKLEIKVHYPVSNSTT